MDIENKYGYYELQKVELEILKNFIDICDKQHWEYFALGGTLLGAVRHKGFIPWDDDIDIGMPRVDFESFCEKASELLDSRFQLFTFQKDKNYMDYIPKIVDKRIVLRTYTTIGHDIQYPWIDIFPLDGMPASRGKLWVHKIRLLSARLKVNYSMFSNSVDVRKKNRKWYEKLLIQAGKKLPVEKIFNKDKELRRLDKLLKKYSYEDSKYLINFMGAYKFKEMFPKQCYGKGKVFTFETLKINGPIDEKYVLTQLYKDYKKVPSIEERRQHELEIIKFDITEEK